LTFNTLTQLEEPLWTLVIHEWVDDSTNECTVSVRNSLRISCWCA